MNTQLVQFSSRSDPLIFWAGCLAVTVGVILHLPMYLMGKDNGYVLAGMPMDAPMLWGMAGIVLGIALAGYALLPKAFDAEESGETGVVPEDAPLTSAHWRVAALLCVALIIDIMKPASLGFVLPGMKAEYGIDAKVAAWLPFSALTGTVMGSFLWGVLADRIGRRASLLLSAIMFIGTAICGAMPDFWWNVGMCWLMGLAAGGMLPVAYALLAEIMPTRHRGRFLVLVGGIGAVGGYFAASGISALFQPEWSWRILWFAGLPSGLLLVFLSPFLPESARFLLSRGRSRQARAELARFGVRFVSSAASVRPGGSAQRETHHYTGLTLALTISALCWGFVNFGVLVWLPGALIAEGRSVAAASALIAKSALISAPIVIVSAWLYGAWSTKGTLVTMMVIMMSGLAALIWRDSGWALLSDPLVPVSLLVIGSSGVVSILLPYTAESYALGIRGRSTGWIAGCTKLGGLGAQGLGLVGIVPALHAVTISVALTTGLAMALILRFSRETRGRDLSELELQARKRAA